jgi:hypothetical protein
MSATWGRCLFTISMHDKVETPIHDNDLNLTLQYIAPQSGWQWTWSCPELHMCGFIGMEDGNFWHLGGVTRWNSQLLKYTWTFLATICVASQLFLCFFWIHLWVKNRCLQHACFKNLCKIAQASNNSDSNAQHFLLDLLTHSWFHSMLFALPGYQFPYTVMNRCLYLTWLRSLVILLQSDTG